MSIDKRSVLLHQAASQEMGQFDRFVLGATLAGCAYLGQTIPYGQLGYNLETMYLHSLLVLSLSGVFGFKRIEAGLHASRLNSKYLHYQEMRNSQAAHACEPEMSKWSVKTGTYYRLRNTTLVLGFACYVATKVFATYLS